MRTLRRGEVKRTRRAMAVTVVTAATAAMIPAAMALTAASAQAGTTETASYACTGSAQDFIVPPGVTSLTFDAVGAAGAALAEDATTPAASGSGGEVTGTLDVSPGDSLDINVGCQDGYGYANGGAGGTAGGNAGANGGGATGIVDSTTDTILVVAAGGGGGGGASSGGTGGNGGTSGGATGTVALSGLGGSLGGSPTPAGTDGGSIPQGGNGGGGGGGGGGGFPNGGAGGVAGAESGSGGGGGGGGLNYFNLFDTPTLPNSGSASTASDGSVSLSYAIPSVTTLATTPFPTAVTLGATTPTLNDSATLAGGSNPTGTITFTLYQGSTLVDTEPVTVSGDGTYTTPTGYTLPTTGAVAGTYQWDAIYTGDANNTSASDNNDPAEQVVVSKADTATALVSSANPSPSGQQVFYTATVSPAPDGGTVTFTDNGTTICAAATVTSGQATCSVNYPGPGSHPITASYNGDASYNGSMSNTVDETVTAQATTTTLESSANPSPWGQQVVYTATVSPVPDGGTVTFTDNGTAICPLATVSGGQATCQVTYAGPGPHSVVAVYGGDASYPGSTSNTVDETVTAKATATTLESSANPSPWGQQVFYTATVSPVPDGGTVTFTDNGTTICAAATVTSGQATCSVTYPGSGSHPITASYNGDASYNGSMSNTVDETVTSRATTTTLASSGSPSVAGATVTYTATVAPAPDGGTVTFTDNGATVCTATVSAGTATCPVTYHVVGSHTVAAAYDGDSDYAGSTSNTLTQLVTYAVKTLYNRGKSCRSGTDFYLAVQLRDAGGHNVSAKAILLKVTSLSPSPAPGKAPTGLFTFKQVKATGGEAGPQYQLLVNSHGYPPGTYTLSFTVTGDPVTHTITFTITRA